MISTNNDYVNQAFLSTSHIYKYNDKQRSFTEIHLYKLLNDCTIKQLQKSNRAYITRTLITNGLAY